MTLLIAALALAPSTAQVTYVRHAETVANATGRYNSRTLNVFSTKGEGQVKALTERLRPRRFDAILVSPSPRALRTVAPYLKATGQKALVWPLLYECCTGRRPRGVKATSFTWGARVTLAADIAPLFTVRPGMDRLPVAPGWPEGLAQSEAAVREFKAKFARGRVLVVGHSGMGGQFIYGLTGRREHVKNATEIEFPLSAAGR